MSDPSEFRRHRLFSATWGTFHDDFGVAALPHTAATAVELGQALSDADVLLEEPVTITDSDGVTVRNLLDDFLNGPGESLILYFASHGLVPSVRHASYRLATTDTRAPDDGIRAFPMDEIISMVAGRSDRRVLLIVDACFSGWSGQQVVQGGGSLDRGPLESPGLSFLASSSPYKPSIARHGSRFTLFGERLITAIRNHQVGDALDVGGLYKSVLLATADGEPEPVLVSQGSSHEAVLLPSRAAEPAADPEYANRAEILYVDDVEDERLSFREGLAPFGHSVTLKNDPPSATDALRRSHFDVIVLDLLMVGDEPATDLIRFVGKHITGSKVIVATREREEVGQIAWRHLDNVFSYPNPVDAFTFKPEHIDQAVVFANEIRRHRGQVLSHIDRLGELVPLVSGRMIKRRAEGHELGHDVLQLHARITVEQLVSRWFSDESDATDYLEGMTMEPLGLGRSSCSVFSLVPRVKGLDATHVNPLVLKLGPAAEITEEVSRFNKYVQVGVPLSVRTDMVGHAVTGKVGGLIYSLIGGDQQHVREAASLSFEEIEACLLRIMDPDGKRWLGSTQRDAGVRPKHFFEAKGWSKTRFQESARAISTGLANAGVDDAWRVDQYFMGNPGIDNAHPSTLVHGDLHLGNIVAYDENRYALIDYRNVTIGPRCADFATLEVDCWLLAVPDTTLDRGHLISELVDAAGGGLNDVRDPDDVAPWLRDSHRLAVTVRRLAQQNFKDLTAREYASMLWFTAVRRAEMRATATSSAEKLALKTVPHALALVSQQMTS